MEKIIKSKTEQHHSILIPNTPSRFRKILINTCVTCKYARGQSNENLSCEKHGMAVHAGDVYPYIDTVCDDFNN